MSEQTPTCEAEDPELDSETPTDDPEVDAAESEALAALQAELEDVRDQMLRAVADGQNIRRRAEKDVQDAKQYAVTSFARDLLSVADNLSRALDALSPDMRDGMGASGKQLLEGVEMTQKALLSVFERHGVKPVIPHGETFDPNLHQAVAQIPSSVEAGRVAEVMQSGYRIGDRVLRAAMVAVSTGPGAAAPVDAASADASEPGGRVDTKA
ncbi:MAG: nucleotide exchange factor GrpE [Maricaulaceae bacterium]